VFLGEKLITATVGEEKGELTVFHLQHRKQRVVLSSGGKERVISQSRQKRS
jgi:hypothetical protein